MGVRGKGKTPVHGGAGCTLYELKVCLVRVSNIHNCTYRHAC